MPLPNFHSARVKSPTAFKDLPGKKGKFRTKRIAKGISILIGRLKKAKKGQENSGVVQAYRFDKSVYTPVQAKEWLKKHKVSYIRFEKAKEEKSERVEKEGVTLDTLANALREQLRDTIKGV